MGPRRIPPSAAAGAAAAAAAVPVALVTAAGGDVTALALAGSLFGAGFTELLKDVLERRLSPRERDRIERVLGHAARRVARRQEEDTLRADGFLKADGYGYSSFGQLAEAVMLAARDAHEERKLPYLGNLLAAIAFDLGVDHSTGNWAVKTAEELTWNQYLCLAMVGNPQVQAPNVRLGSDAGTWSSFTIHDDLIALGKDGRRLFKIAEPTGESSYPRFSYSATELELANGGALLYRLMGLGEVPGRDTDDLVTRLLLARPRDDTP